MLLSGLVFFKHMKNKAFVLNSLLEFNDGATFPEQ